MNEMDTPRYCQDCGRQVSLAGQCKCKSTRVPQPLPPFHARAYCRTCSTLTRWQQIGYEVVGSTPAVVYWRCEECQAERYQFADCQNVESMCLTVLEENLRRTGANLDHDEALARLQLEAWRLYLAWESDGLPFESYGFGLLRRRAYDIYRQQLGRNMQKPLANAVSLSALVDYGDDGAEELLGRLRSSETDPSLIEFCIAGV